MRYFVITSDGQKYGPADVPLLSQWAREGRLSPTSMLEGEDGTQVVASQLPGLSFPETAAPMTPPVQSAPPPGGNPYAGYSDRGVMFSLRKQSPGRATRRSPGPMDCWDPRWRMKTWV